MVLTIRSERPSDVLPVFEIHRQAFGQDSESRLVERLRREPGFLPGLSLVAENNGKLVGHILFSPALIHTKSGPRSVLVLAPLATLPEHQRTGVGSALVRAGLAACLATGHLRVIVVGHPSFYPRFGFVPASRWGIRPPFTVPDDAFMACELVPGALDEYAGEVEFSAPFAGV